MAVEDSGTKTADGSEQTLTTQTTAGKKLLLMVSLANLAAGATPDIVVLKVKEKVLTGNTAAIIYQATYVGGLVVDPNPISPPIDVEFGAIFTLQQVQGSNHNFDWSVRSLLAFPLDSLHSSSQLRLPR
jgi:hypothetical protein